MSRISRNLSIIYRAERAIARRRLAVARAQTGTMAFAGVVAGIGVVMLNVAGFFALEAAMSPAAAALCVALANLVLAGLLAALAGRMNVDAELEPITEVRDLAMEDLEAEIQDVALEARDAARNVRAIARDPFGTVGASAIGPLLSFLIKSAKK